MNIVVFTRETPDTAATITVDNGQVSWGDAKLVPNPWDEYAYEEAITQVDAHGGAATVMALGGEGMNEAVKHALAMGCNEAVLLSDAAFEGVDALGEARIFAAALNKQADTDLVLMGRQTIDDDTGLVPMMLARLMGWSGLSYVSKIVALDADARTITVERAVEEGRQVVTAPLPAVLSVMKEMNEPRYPSFMGIRKASRAKVPTWDAGALGLDPATLAATVTWGEVRELPKHEGTVEMIEGDSPAAIARTLMDRLIEEKVL